MKLQWLLLLALFVHNSWEINPNKCKKDILILWDNSNSVGLKDYVHVIKFLKDLVENKDLNVGEHGTHLGFITFSGPPKEKYVRPGESHEDRTKVLLKVGQIIDPEEIIQKLVEYDYTYDLSGRMTYTGKAFTLAKKEFYKKSPRNHRDGIDDVILLFTDGEPYPSDEEKTADKVSRILKKENNVTIIGLAVGQQSKVAEFKKKIKDWSSPNLVFQSTFDGLDNVIDELIKDFCRPDPGTGICRCEGDSSSVEYVENEDSKLLFTWERPKLKCGDSATVPEPKVHPEGAESPKEYGPGNYSITYTFLPPSGDEKRPSVKCSVNVNIRTCGCPPVKTIRGEVPKGAEKVYLKWSEPVPQPCQTKPSPSNPQKNDGWFSVGRHSVTYTYTHTTNLHEYTMECPVMVYVTGQFCGRTAFNPDTHICCCNKPKKKKTFRDNCCDEENYNPDEKVCCPNGRIVSFGGNCS